MSDKPQPNYDRHEKEITGLKRRVSDLENAVFALQREIYTLKHENTQCKIDEYLDNYKPKTQ